MSRSARFRQGMVGARMICHPLNVNADEATGVAKQLSPLDKLGSALVKQLMKVVDEGVGPITGSRDYAEARLAQFGDPEKAIKRIVAETTASSAMAGFATGLGGFIALPVTLPAKHHWLGDLERPDGRRDRAPSWLGLAG